MTGYVIPFTGLTRQHHLLREEILAATDQVLSSGVLMSGDHTDRLEQWLCERNRVQHAITCHSGTQALELIAQYWREDFADLEIANPPTVMIPNLTYAATANAFMRAGWNLHFVDVDCHGVMDLHKIPQLVDFQALVLVGLYGASVSHLADTKAWRNLVHGDAVVIEDAAQHWLSADCTRMGAASAISFDPTKNLPASGNGGAVVTNNADFADWCRAQRKHGLPHYRTAGTNSRMSELDCAHILVRARYLDAWQARRGAIARYYHDQLQDLPVRCLIEPHEFAFHSFHKFVIDLDARDHLYAHLARAGIETRVHYAEPVSDLGVMRQFASPNMMSRAHALSRRVLSLPIYPELSDTEAEEVMRQVRAFFS